MKCVLDLNFCTHPVSWYSPLNLPVKKNCLPIFFCGFTKVSNNTNTNTTGYLGPFCVKYSMYGFKSWKKALERSHILLYKAAYSNNSLQRTTQEPCYSFLTAFLQPCYNLPTATTSKNLAKPRNSPETNSNSLTTATTSCQPSKASQRLKHNSLATALAS